MTDLDALIARVEGALTVPQHRVDAVEARWEADWIKYTRRVERP